jgi:hypothetical protein
MSPIDLHASRSNEVLIPAILCPALAALAVLLRLYTRCVLLKNAAWDDAFVVLALVGYLVQHVLALTSKALFHWQFRRSGPWLVKLHLVRVRTDSV